MQIYVLDALFLAFVHDGLLHIVVKASQQVGLPEDLIKCQSVLVLPGQRVRNMIIQPT